MAFNVFFEIVENNPIYETKSAPWLCDKCHTMDRVLLRMKVDYDVIILCKKCLMASKRFITDKEKEIKNEESKRNL